MIRPGDVYVESCVIYSSVQPVPYIIEDWTSISVTESIGVNYVSLEMTLADTQNLIEVIPIVGNERIVVKFKTSSTDKLKIFSGRIIDIPTQDEVNQGTRVFTIIAISEEFVRNQKIKFSKSYKETYISDMVFDIFYQYIKPVSGKDIIIHPTLGRHSKVIPNYSPIRAIEWLSKWAQSPNYRKGASYIFFETTQNFFFGPIEYLIDQNTKSTRIPVYKRSTNVMAGNASNKNLDSSMYNIVAINFDRSTELNKIVTGQVASSVMSHDLVLRSTQKTSYNYFDSFNEYTHLEKYPTTNDIKLGEYYNSRILLNPLHYGAYSSEINTNTNIQVASIRQSQIKQYLSNSLRIIVPGDSNRIIGEIVEVEVPSIGRQSELEPDRYLTGKYLIWSIRHAITKESGKSKKYLCHMQLYKDSNRVKIPSQQAFPFGEI